jgi:hypothetical protein
MTRHNVHHLSVQRGRGGAHRAIRDGATAGRPMHLPQKD